MKRSAVLVALFICAGAFAQSYPGANNTNPGLGSNDAPVWHAAPTPVFIEDTASSYLLVPGDVSDPNGDALTFVNETGCTLPTGVTLDSANDEIDYDGLGTQGTTSSCVFSADDGIATKVNSSAFTIEIADSPPCWPVQGAATGIPSVRDRNPAACASPSEGRGFGMMGTNDTGDSIGRHAYSDFNIDTQVGSAPDIYHITTNASTGAGSLRDFLEIETGPRIGVFDVGGDFTFTQSVRANSGKFWLAGQTAPCMVNILVDANFFSLGDSDIFMQHMMVWNDAALSEWIVQDIVRPRAMDVNDNGNNDWARLVLDHMFWGGATDQSLNIFARDKITVIDSMIALARGNTTYNHAYGGLWGSNNANSDSATDVSGIGLVWAFNSRRNPLWRMANGLIANNLSHEMSQAGMEIAGTVSDGSLTMTLNILGNRWLDQPNDGEMFLYQSAIAATLATNSQLHLNDNFGPRYSSDDWQLVTDSDNQQADVRDNSVVAVALPTGFVAAPNRSLSEAEFIEQVLRNNGPRPSDQFAFIQDIKDDVTNKTGSIQDDYTAPTLSCSPVTFVPVANPHQEFGTTGRSNLENQILTDGEDFYQ